MILLHIQSAQGPRLGLKTAQGIIDVAAAQAALSANGTNDFSAVPTDESALFAGGQPALSALAGLASYIQANALSGSWLLREENIQLGPCVTKPGKIICIGLNYRRHAAESGMPVPGSPVVFAKFSNALAAPNEKIPMPPGANSCDYEVELTAVIGRRAWAVSEDEALSYVFGYCNGNDLSEREWQFRTGQWILGKTLDKFLPLGPYLVTADEVGDPQQLQLHCWVNGELRQNSNTSDMIFPVKYLISYLSHCMTLEPGDIICTGTPEGVISGMKEKNWLKDGDEVTIEVEKLGRLTNIMVRA
jgi:2-keto-4-pentenoate hydratase/2-oxohepta-3-ene-1,7-dioic acid hydratase in catechol pathway